MWCLNKAVVQGFQLSHYLTSSQHPLVPSLGWQKLFQPVPPVSWSLERGWNAGRKRTYGKARLTCVPQTPCDNSGKQGVCHVSLTVTPKEPLKVLALPIPGTLESAVCAVGVAQTESHWLRTLADTKGILEPF